MGYSPWGYKTVGHNLATKKKTKNNSNTIDIVACMDICLYLHYEEIAT